MTKLQSEGQQRPERHKKAKRDVWGETIAETMKPRKAETK